MVASTTDLSSKVTTVMTVFELGKKFIKIEEVNYYNELAKIWKDLLRAYAGLKKLVDPRLSGYFQSLKEDKVSHFEIPIATLKPGEIEQKFSKNSSGDHHYSDYQKYINYAVSFLKGYEEILKNGDTFISRKIWVNLSSTLAGNQYVISAMAYLLKHTCLHYSPIGNDQFEQCNNTLEFISEFIEQYAIHRRDDNHRKRYRRIFKDLKSAKKALKRAWNIQIASQKLIGIKQHAVTGAEDCLRLALMIVYPHVEVISHNSNIQLDDLKNEIILQSLSNDQEDVELPSKKDFLFYESLTTVIHALYFSGLYTENNNSEHKEDAFKRIKTISLPIFSEKEKRSYVEFISPGLLFNKDKRPYLMAFSVTAGKSNALIEVDVIEFNERVKIVENLLNLSLALNDLAKLAVLSQNTADNHGQLAILNRNHYKELFKVIRELQTYAKEKLKNVSKKLKGVFENLKKADGSFQVDKVVNFYKGLLKSIRLQVKSSEHLVGVLESNRANFEEILDKSEKNDKKLVAALSDIEKRYLMKTLSPENAFVRSLVTPQEGVKEPTIRLTYDRELIESDGSQECKSIQVNKEAALLPIKPEQVGNKYISFLYDKVQGVSIEEYQPRSIFSEKDMKDFHDLKRLCKDEGTHKESWQQLLEFLELPIKISLDIESEESFRIMLFFALFNSLFDSSNNRKHLEKINDIVREEERYWISFHEEERPAFHLEKSIEFRFEVQKCWAYLRGKIDNKIKGDSRRISQEQLKERKLCSTEGKLEERRFTLQSINQPNLSKVAVNAKKETVDMGTSRKNKAISTSEQLASSQSRDEKKESRVILFSEQNLKTGVEKLSYNLKFSSVEVYLGKVVPLLFASSQLNLLPFNIFYDTVFKLLNDVKKTEVSSKETKEFFAKYKISVGSFPDYVRNNFLTRWFYNAEYKRGRLFANNLLISAAYRNLKKRAEILLNPTQDYLSSHKYKMDYENYRNQVMRYNDLLNAIEADTRNLKDTLSTNHFINWWRGRIRNQFEYFLAGLRKKFTLPSIEFVSEETKTDTTGLVRLKLGSSPLICEENKIYTRTLPTCIVPSDPIKKSSSSLEDKAIEELLEGSCTVLTNLLGCTDSQRLISETYSCILSCWQRLVDYAENRDSFPIGEKLMEKIAELHRHPLIRIPEGARAMSQLGQACFASTIPASDYFSKLVNSKLDTIIVSLQGKSTLGSLNTILSKELSQLRDSQASTFLSNYSLNPVF